MKRDQMIQVPNVYFMIIQPPRIPLMAGFGFRFEPVPASLLELVTGLLNIFMASQWFMQRCVSRDFPERGRPLLGSTAFRLSSSMLATDIAWLGFPHAPARLVMRHQGCVRSSEYPWETPIDRRSSYTENSKRKIAWVRDCGACEISRVALHKR
jgi:hypothetical protein